MRKKKGAGELIMLSSLISIVFVVLAFVLAQKAFSRKDKAYGMVFSLIGIVLLAIAINEGLWVNLILLLIKAKDVIVFLVIGQIHICMIWIYCILTIGFLFGVFLMSLLSIAKESDRRAERNSGTIDGVKLVKKIKERDL